MSDERSVDAVVLGAGPAGLAAALLLAEAGATVDVVDPVAPDAPAPPDPRTAALLAPALALMERLGVWPEPLAAEGAALETMRMVDAEGGEARASVDFQAREIGAERFGVNLPTLSIRAALAARARAHPLIALHAPDAPAALLFSEDAARVRLASGGAVTARLAIAAEGRDSPARDALGIRARRVDYGQQALVFWVAHGRPHAQVSTETWRDGGPFTLVPLPDAPDAPLERRHRSSVVWMVSNAEAAELTALDAQDFGLAATARSLGALGPLTLISERAARPIISMIADRFAGPRAALLGEAAHVVPPIGAQGLNMSLADAADLADRVAAARAAGGDIGAPALLSDYEAARRGDARARVAATAGLNLAAIGALHPIRAARRLGLATLGASSVLRRAAMRYGLGG